MGLKNRIDSGGAYRIDPYWFAESGPYNTLCVYYFVTAITLGPIAKEIILLFSDKVTPSRQLTLSLSDIIERLQGAVNCNKTTFTLILRTTLQNHV